MGLRKLFIIRVTFAVNMFLLNRLHNKETVIVIFKKMTDNNANSILNYII